jgi:hypothetical protein
MTNDNTKQISPQSRRVVFANRQAEDARHFEFLEKVATAIIEAVAPLAVEAREQPTAVKILVSGGHELRS